MKETWPIWQSSKDVAQTIGVLIPTYKRSDDLLRCLEALKLQKHPPDDVLLIVRSIDHATDAALKSYNTGMLPIRIFVTDVPGTVHAHNLGIENAQTDVIAMIDDDTVPQPEWLSVIHRGFQEDASLGGLGGRDRCFDGTHFDDRREDCVGRLQWFGRTIGNHHLGFGPKRDVDLLKGANMSFRRVALNEARCDVRLRGTGAQPNEDISLGLAVKRKGWRVAYDPSALVYHYQGTREEVRHYGGQSAIKESKAYKEFAYNEVIGIWDYLTPTRRLAFMVWSVFVGTRTCPGLVQAFRFTPTLKGQSWYRFTLAQKAKFDAFIALLFPAITAKHRSD